MTWNHAYLLAFAVPLCEEEDGYATLESPEGQARILTALKERVAQLDQDRDELVEALDVNDSYDEKEWT